MKKSKKGSIPKVFEFKVTLLNVNPPVTRIFLAHEFIQLNELHDLIQFTMGWENKHLYKFQINNESFGADEEKIGDEPSELESIELNRVLGEATKFFYDYDFGDFWRHEVEIIKIHEHDSNIRYPTCIGGENACPPEDCGGPHGFEELKKTISGKDSKKKKELLEWLGGFYDPSTFDPNLINRYLLWR